MYELLKEEKRYVIEDVSINQLGTYEEEIFSPYEGQRLDEMVESIKDYGIITPVLVRELDEGYQILSGNNRVKAARLAGLDVIPVINKGKLDEAEAKFIITESNISQRGFMEMSISERAYCVSIRHEALKHQGFRRDLINEVDLLLENIDGKVTDLNVGDVVADSFDLSPRTVRNYVRINKLIKDLKVLVDSKRVGTVAAVDLSYLKDAHQEMVAEVVNENEFKVSIKQAAQLRELEGEGGFSQEKVFYILVKETIAKPVGARISNDLMDRYFDGYETEEIMEVLEKALEMWFNGKQGLGVS